jgi:hypothetical protein
MVSTLVCKYLSKPAFTLSIELTDPQIGSTQQLQTVVVFQPTQKTMLPFSQKYNQRSSRLILAGMYQRPFQQATGISKASTYLGCRNTSPGSI